MSASDSASARYNEVRSINGKNPVNERRLSIWSGRLLVEAKLCEWSIYFFDGIDFVVRLENAVSS